MSNETNSTGTIVLIVIVLCVAAAGLTLAIVYQKKNEALISSSGASCPPCSTSDSEESSGEYTPESVNFKNIDMKKLKQLCPTEVAACKAGSACQDTLAEHAAEHPDDALFCHKYENEDAQALVDCYVKNHSKLHASGASKPAANSCTNKEGYTGVNNNLLNTVHKVIAKAEHDAEHDADNAIITERYNFDSCRKQCKRIHGLDAPETTIMDCVGTCISSLR